MFALSTAFVLYCNNLCLWRRLWSYFMHRETSVTGQEWSVWGFRISAMSRIPLKPGVSLYVHLTFSWTVKLNWWQDMQFVIVKCTNTWSLEWKKTLVLCSIISLFNMILLIISMECVFFSLTFHFDPWFNKVPPRSCLFTHLEDLPANELRDII